MAFDLLELLKSRKTAYEFTEEKITKDKLLKILEAGRWAPSRINIQPWHFILVDDKKKIKQLISEANYGDFHEPPSAIIALVLRTKCLTEIRNELKGRDYLLENYMCIAMAGLQMVLEAHFLGISSSFLTIDGGSKKMLGLSKEDFLPLILALGYEKKWAFQKGRFRKPLMDIVSHNLLDNNGF